jgi:hypothetical protein
MSRRPLKISIRGAVAASLAAALTTLAAAPPARAQFPATCTAAQNAAAKCVAGTALNAKLLLVPSGIAPSPDGTLDLASPRAPRSRSIAVTIAAALAAVAAAMPPVNVNGSPNAAAQIAAINAMIEAAVSRGILPLPARTTLAQLQSLAQNSTANAAADSNADAEADPGDDRNDDASLSPATVLRVIDSYIVTATDANGNVRWATADAGISAAIGNLLSSGMIQLPSGMTLSKLDLFAGDVARAIAAYKSATGRRSL